MNPPTAEDARALLLELGAPRRLIRHVELVGEAAELILVAVEACGVAVDRELVRVGVVLHDVGKIAHPHELDGPGSDHEPSGEALLVSRGVSPQVARICISHARWRDLDVSLEEALVALADKLWKGVRKSDLEKLVIDLVGHRTSMDPWDLFIKLDTVFEEVAGDGADRLRRSRVGAG